MKNDGKFSIGMYCFAFVGGVLSGLLLQKANYYQGKADAYDEISGMLDGAIQNSKDILNKSKEGV